MLTAITAPGEIKRARLQFYHSLRSDIWSWRDLGTPGGTDTYRFWWHPKPGLWAVLEASESSNRSWNCFGTNDPTEGSGTIAPVCEINFPHRGFDRRVAGLFARDYAGRVHVMHSGKIGGGRLGISKSRFVDFFAGSDQWVKVIWPDHKVSDMLDLGPVDADDLVHRVHHFVHTVERFKHSVQDGSSNAELDDTEGDSALEPSYSPEFSGQRAAYFVGTVESRCDHGRVVDGLRERLGANLPGPSFSLGNARHHDLYLARSNRAVAHFEVKTDVTPASIYTAIGQLMYHGIDAGPRLARVIVAPENLPADSSERLERLGIEVLTYRWARNRPEFPGLPKLLARRNLERS